VYLSHVRGSLGPTAGPGSIKQPQNSMTLWDTLHGEFGDFNPGLELLCNVSSLSLGATSSISNDYGLIGSKSSLLVDIRGNPRS
jgi:hypothetical protein